MHILKLATLFKERNLIKIQISVDDSGLYFFRIFLILSLKLIKNDR